MLSRSGSDFPLRPFEPLQESKMNKLLAGLIIAAVAGVASAQTGDPKLTTQEKQSATQATTGAAAAATTGAQTAKQQEVNVQKSKQTAKMTSAEKNKALRTVNANTVNPENTAGVGATDRAQKSSTAASKATTKQRPDLSTPEAQKAMQKAATP
jgi:hypothetical protein